VYETLEDFRSDFISSVEDEHQSLWDQGDKLVMATQPEELKRMGADKAQVIAEAGKCSGRGERTIYSRLQTSSVFPEGERYHDLPWFTHYVCAIQTDPHYWLERAHNENLSAAVLRAEILAANGEVPKTAPEYLIKSAECRVMANRDGSLVLIPAYPVDGLGAGEVLDGCLVTIATAARVAA
jgi:hypothetical protein